METKTTTRKETNKKDRHEPQWPGPKKKIGTYPNPTEEIERVKQLRSLVEDTQRDLEPAPRQIQITDTVFPTQQQPHKVHRPLAIPSVIQEESDLKSWESGRTHFLLERMFIEGLPDPIKEMEIPSSPRQGAEAQKVPLNIAKLMDFMASEVRTTIMSKLYKDPEIVSALRAFLNGELKFGLPQFSQMDGAGEMPIE
ncbi:hypothetical protein DD606_25070 [Enterobacter cloacae complex sp. GF14B]|nr:hypothetical protein DD606_25070 [Enterobacter cloacae complex sp. GF14B]